MQVYLRERLWLYFYCATAPTASETAEQFCEMAALQVALGKVRMREEKISMPVVKNR